MNTNILGRKNKKLSLFALLFLSATLILTARLISQRQETRNLAAGTARLYFTPSTTQSTPLQKNANDTISVQLMLDPGQSSVSFVKFIVNYDQTKLSVSGANAVAVNANAFPQTFEGPILTPGNIAASVSIGNDPTKAVTTTTQVATITFTAIGNTTSPIQISYGNTSQVLSLGANQSATDNALGTTEPFYLTIGQTGGTYPTTPMTTQIPGTTMTPSTSPQNPKELIGCTVNLPLTQNAYDIANVNNQLWITTTNGIVRFNPDGTQIGDVITGNGLESPSGIAVVNNEVWVLNRFNKKISRFNLDGTPSKTPILLTNTQLPTTVRLTGLVVNGQEVWVTDEDNGMIYKLDSTTGELLTAPLTNAALDAPSAIAKIGNEIWVLNSNFHNKINLVPDIVRFNTSGQFISSIQNTGRTSDELPIDLMVVGNDRWYLVNNTDARILHFAADGTPLGALSLIRTISARALTTVNDNVFILEHTGTGNDLRIYNVDRTPNLCLPTPTLGPTGVLPTGPSGTGVPARTTLALSLVFHGIGSGGDSLNQNSKLSNKNPIHQQKMLNIQIVNADDQIVATKIAPAFYNSTTGQYFSNVVINDPIPDGDYVVKVKTDPYIRKVMPGFLTVKSGQKNTIDVTDLVTGDINGDNLINALDYNILYDCGYGAIKPLPMINPTSAYNRKSCKAHDEREFTDLNDNGVIDGTDYNLFIRELSVGFGQ